MAAKLLHIDASEADTIIIPTGRTSRMTTEMLIPGVEELDRDGGRLLLDEAAQHYLGVSGAEFIRGWDAGEYDEDPDRPEVMQLAMLLPFGR